MSFFGLFGSKPKPPESTLEELLRRALERLPLPPSHLIERASIPLRPEEMQDLRYQYEALQESPAWRHFAGKLWELREILERKLLQGSYDRQGNDQTPYIRASYGMLLQVMAIPEQVILAAIQLEEAITGKLSDSDFKAPPQGPDLDNSSNHT